MVASSGDFDRTFDVLLTMNLSEIIVDFTGNEIRLAGDWFQRALPRTKLTTSLRQLAP
jgi:hypothetical protein